MQENKQKIRLRFEKRDTAVFLSHLDLMRVLARGLSRAEIPALKTEGFNPHAYLSIPCALSLGFEGLSEICDIALPEGADYSTIGQKVNSVLPDGIRILSVYPATRNCREMAMASYRFAFRETPPPTEELMALLAQKPLIVLKRSKRKEEERDIAPMLLSAAPVENGLEVRVVCSPTDNLNPRLLGEATGVGALKSAVITRTAFYDKAGELFA